jgi:uncharacterized membrane protein
MMSVRMTLNQRYYGGAAAIILAMLAATVVAYPQLPAMVPLHWNAHGLVNGWGPKWLLFLFGPGSMSALVLLFSALPWLSPKKFEVDSFRATYLYMMIVTITMLAYVEMLVLIWGLGMKFAMGSAVEGGVCLFLALLGNVMGKVRRNFYLGIRTPWTLANERVWNATHRMAAKTFFVGGLLGLISVIAQAPFWTPLTFIVAAALVPGVYSLAVYKQLERRGEI